MSLPGSKAVWLEVMDVWCVLRLLPKYVSFVSEANLGSLQQTAQLLEALHANYTTISASIPSGLVLSNDSDNKRRHLIHQPARLPSPALIVMNLDASNYASIRVPITPHNGLPYRPASFRQDTMICRVAVMER